MYFWSFVSSVVVKNGTFPVIPDRKRLKAFVKALGAVTACGSDHVTRVIAVWARQEAAVLRGGL